MLALDRAAALITQLAGGTVSRGIIDVNPTFPPVTIQLRAQRVNSFLGISVDKSEIKRCLRTVGMSLQDLGQEGWSVTPPSYRSDVTQEADLIEEVARLRGYEAIPTIPRSEMQEKTPDVEGVLGRRIRTVFSRKAWRRCSI